MKYQRARIDREDAPFTPALKLLSQRGIPFRLASFPCEERTAEEVSRQLQIPLAQVVKTLLLQSVPGGYWLALCPGDRQVNLKRLASLLGERQMGMSPREKVHPVTGYHIGGVSPLGTRRDLPVLMEEAILREREISISAGRGGYQILIDPSLLAGILAPRLRVLAFTDPRDPGQASP
jgi:Cys-tRNA(Pro)/Cys-tRNA(Cys) deacylase